MVSWRWVGRVAGGGLGGGGRKGRVGGLVGERREREEGKGGGRRIGGEGEEENLPKRLHLHPKCIPPMMQRRFGSVVTCFIYPMPADQLALLCLLTYSRGRAGYKKSRCTKAESTKKRGRRAGGR